MTTSPVREEALRSVLQSLRTGVALVDPETWEVLFENGKFFQSFPPDAGADESTLVERMPGFDADRAAERIAAGRPYQFESEAKIGPRTVVLRNEFRPTPDDDDHRVIIESTDISKERETRYMLDSYSKMAERNARDLAKEKDRVERLLLNIMPRTVLEEMKELGTATPQRFDDATILLLDFVGFTDMALSQDPNAVVSELNDIFSAFDRIVEMFGCERIRTVGDAYMAVAGLPDPNPDHAASIGKVALRMRKYLERRNEAYPERWSARFGIHTGAVIGSLVGISKYVYDLFGPGVNMAARMESNSEPMRITVSEATYHLLKDDFMLIDRGEFDIKGFGTCNLYYLEAELGG